MKVIFNAMLAALIVGILVTSTSAATTVHASNHKSGSDSSTGSSPKGSDTSGSSSSSSTAGPGSSGTQSSSSGSNPPSSDLSSGQSSGTISGPNPSGSLPLLPGQPQSLTACPNGGQPDSSGKCPSIPAPPTEKCPGGAQPDKNGKCLPPPPGCPKPGDTIMLLPCPPPPPIHCPDGTILVDGKCRDDCHKIDNSTIIECHGPSHTRTIVHNTIQQVPVPTGTNDINLMIVTTCTADQNNGVLNGNLAALCDASITMMHDDGLNAQLPQVDMYLKARGLLS